MNYTLLKENCVNITKAALTSAAKWIAGPLLYAALDFMATGQNPFTVKTWYLWAIPALAAAFKAYTKANELKSLAKSEVCK